MTMFLCWLGGAVALFLAAVLLSIGLLPIPAAGAADWISLAGWFLGLAIIFCAALVLRRTPHSHGIDLTVAAEFVVVFGIFGLLIQLASGVYVAYPMLGVHAEEFSLAALRPILSRFAEGLAAAACAPIAAVTLRLVDSGETSARGGGDPASSPELAAAFTRLESAVAATSAAIEKSGSEFANSVAHLGAAARELDTALSGNSARIVQELNKLAQALETAQRSAGGAAGEIGELGREAGNARALLRALQEAIDDVTNFARGVR